MSKAESTSSPLPAGDATNAKCDFDYPLQALLLRLHNHAKRQRLGAIGVFCLTNTSDTSPVRGRAKMVLAALRASGSRALRFEAVSGTQRDPSGAQQKVHGLGGEAILSIDAWPLRLAFRALSNLTAHLSQATLAISTIAQLPSNVERCVSAEYSSRNCAAFRPGKTGSWVTP
ncbi:hypothetical protein K438DRAFT_1982042 [Mycena galopus ATCC 62051]|nr:hypothetical protein K438DRAFT_1982042 [Mycena galopus ATCC 62051]